MAHWKKQSQLEREMMAYPAMNAATVGAYHFGSGSSETQRNAFFKTVSGTQATRYTAREMLGR